MTLSNPTVACRLVDNEFLLLCKAKLLISCICELVIDTGTDNLSIEKYLLSESSAPEFTNN